MHLSLRGSIGPLLISALVAACGGGAPSQVVSSLPTGCVAGPTPAANLPGWSTAAQAPTVFPAIVNSASSLTCGENRLLFTFLDANNRIAAKPNRTVELSLYDLARDPATSTAVVNGRFVWGIENERGFYVANVTFNEAGVWGAQFVTAVEGGVPETIRMTFEVATSSATVRVGDPAPASDTATSASVGGDVAKISTDTNPDPALYKTSVKEALAHHDPFVLIFATPKFCVSAQCGPTLNRVKPLVTEFPTVAFINVEPYLLTFQNNALQPVLDAQGNLQAVQAVTDWGILTEPWVFVVDRTGTVMGSFEGVVSTDEIRAAADAVK